MLIFSNVLFSISVHKVDPQGTARGCLALVACPVCLEAEALVRAKAQAERSRRVTTLLSL